MLFNAKTLGTNIKALRDRAGLGQKHVAGYLGVDQSLVSKSESGERTISSDMLDKLGNLFCCPVSVLMSTDECKSPVVFNFRATEIETEDLEALAVINRIALNQMQIDELLEEQ